VVDKFPQLVSGSDLTVAIFGNPAQGTFTLLDLESVSTEKAADLSRRGLDLVGLIGLQGLTPRIELAVPLDAEAIHTLADMFAQLMEAAIIRVRNSMSNAKAN
jgi:hypothetical protein